MTGPVLKDAFDHHIWATQRLLDACSELSDDQLAEPIPAIYGGVLDTLRHIVGSDAWYLFVLSGGQVPDVDEETFGLPELRQVIERHAGAWKALIAGDPDPDADVVAHRDDGSESHAPMGIRLAQALHHGSDHRSQVCTALTTLGVPPPEIDVWDYASAAGRARFDDE